MTYYDSSKMTKSDFKLEMPVIATFEWFFSCQCMKSRLLNEQHNQCDIDSIWSAHIFNFLLINSIKESAWDAIDTNRSGYTFFSLCILMNWYCTTLKWWCAIEKIIHWRYKHATAEREKPRKGDYFMQIYLVKEREREREGEWEWARQKLKVALYRIEIIRAVEWYNKEKGKRVQNWCVWQESSVMSHGSS